MCLKFLFDFDVPFLLFLFLRRRHMMIVTFSFFFCRQHHSLSYYGRWYWYQCWFWCYNDDADADDTNVDDVNVSIASHAIQASVEYLQGGGIITGLDRRTCQFIHFHNIFYSTTCSAIFGSFLLSTIWATKSGPRISSGTTRPNSTMPTCTTGTRGRVWPGLAAA